MAVAIALLVVLAGTILFHVFSPWWWTPIASNWGTMDDTILLTFWITGAVFIAVIFFMVYCVYRYRHTPDRKAEYDPENPKLEAWLSGLTAVGVAAMLAPGLIVWNDYVTVPDDAVQFEAVGQQWSWVFRLPGEDGEFGTVGIGFISADNPFGMNPEDPKGQDDILIEEDEIHLVMDKPVKAVLRSVDVLHDFYVPQFRAKMDMVPGMITYFWMTPTRTGEFEILCAELCGVGHHDMRGTVIVDEQADYDEWLGDQSTYSELIEEARRKAPKETVLAME
jgi:cytochrome c oxidase subunit II